MHIGIIGAGNIGSTLARKLAAAGHRIKLAGSKDPEAVRDKAEAVGAEPASAEDATKDVDIVILSVPLAAIPALAEVIRYVPARIPIIDTGNYYPFRDERIAEIEAGKPESVWVSEQLGRSVTKVFNALLAHTLAENGSAPGTADRIAVPIAGNEPEAKRMARMLVDQAGFDAYDAGELDQSWRQQPGTPAYCTELTLAALPDALAAADRSRAPANRDRVMERLWGDGSTPSHADMVAANRNVADPAW